MRRSFQILPIILTAIFLNGCDEQKPVPITTWTWDDTAISFENIDIAPGTTTDVILVIPDPPYQYSFRVITPKIIDEVNGNPLVLSLHGGVGGAGPEAHKSTGCIAPALDSINAFVLSPNADKVQWYEYYNQEKIVRIISLAVGNWPINTSKLVVTGFSDGGNGTWFFTEFYPQVFSAGIALASSYNTLSTTNEPRKISTPLYVIHSSTDELFPLEQTQFWVDQTISAGSNVTFVIADSLSHYTPCDYMGYFEDAVQWLVDEVW
ncbi:hypothetical protein [Marinoscillum sp. MHG1-6]|uniref:hypothetical protein n=1 Tax=Marinoscillum sp. MHG1-6 TaxID=2959627 RepID=UPI00215758D5|nr:hypothetical protein [Marinoscillum sp. MHG1-6]